MKNRILLITNYALYNLLPNKSYTCKRIIPLENLYAVIVSSNSGEIVFHVKQGFDYRYIIADQHKETLMKVLESSYVLVDSVPDSDLSDFAKLKGRKTKTQTSFPLISTSSVGHNESRFSIDEKNLIEMKDVKITEKDFEIIKLLRHAESQKVWLVRKRDSGQMYEMKIYRKLNLVAENAVDQIWTQRNVLSKASSPYISKLRFAFENYEKIFLVNDYSAGEPLSQQIKRQPKRRYGEQQVKRIIAEVAMALEHLHQLGFVHRGLSTENVLVDSQGHVVLVDMDYIVSMENTPERLLNKSFKSIHTDMFAPELFVTEGSHGTAFDWWFLGLLAYELIVGTMPFASQRMQDVIEKIQKGGIKFAPWVSVEMQDLIQRLLTKEPSDRLCCSTEGLEEMKSHSLFYAFDWSPIRQNSKESLLSCSVSSISQRTCKMSSHTSSELSSSDPDMYPEDETEFPFADISSKIPADTFTSFQFVRFSTESN